jgi:hypothetical protein
VFRIIVPIIFDAVAFFPVICVCPAREAENRIINNTGKMVDKTFMTLIIDYFNRL